MKYFLIFQAIALLAGCATAAPTFDSSPRALTDIERHFLEADFQLVYRKKDLDSVLFSQLHSEVKSIADPGEPYNQTDLIDPSIPTARIEFAGMSESVSFVYYLVGGFAPHSRLLLMNGARNAMCLYFMHYSDNVVDLKRNFSMNDGVMQYKCSQI